MPYEDIELSVRCLDDRRLFKQIVECTWLLNCIGYDKIQEGNPAIVSVKSDFRLRHPTALMWIGYGDLLAEYFNEALKEWFRRGYSSNYLYLHHEGKMIKRSSVPWWLGNEAFHKAMKARLYDKKPDHYKEFIDCKGFSSNQYLYPIPGERFRTKRWDRWVLADREGKCLCDQCEKRAFHPIPSPILKDSIWLSIAQKREVLCIECIQGRLGRLVRRDDLKVDSSGKQLIQNEGFIKLMDKIGWMIT